MAFTAINGIRINYEIRGKGTPLLDMRIPAFIQSGNDASHAHSASWTLQELMPDAELWDVLPPHQNGASTLEQILKFKGKLGL